MNKSGFVHTLPSDRLNCYCECTDLIATASRSTRNKWKTSSAARPPIDRLAKQTKETPSLIAPPPPRIRVWTWLKLRHSFSCVYNTRYIVITSLARKKWKITSSVIPPPPSGGEPGRNLQCSVSWDLVYPSCNAGVCVQVDFRGERRKGFRKKNTWEKTKPIDFLSHLSGQQPRCRRHHRAPVFNSENSGRLWGLRRRSTLVHPPRWSFRVQKHWFVRWWSLSAYVMEIVGRPRECSLWRPWR
jgi:hypothetical protein